MSAGRFAEDFERESAGEGGMIGCRGSGVSQRNRPGSQLAFYESDSGQTQLDLEVEERSLPHPRRRNEERAAADAVFSASLSRPLLSLTFKAS